MPKDLDKVDIYLLTVDIGADIYMIGGHTLIRVVDHLARTDAVFNWGVFDFNEPNFVLNFLKGTNNYRMEAYSMRDIMAIYTYEKRSIFQQKINLTLTQKANFMDALIIASQPENIRFRYHFYFVNCATKALDVIDAGVNGGLKRFLAAKPGSQTLRDLVRTSLIFYPFTSAAVEIIMNGKTDITQTALDETGFPLNMQAHLNNAPQFDESGNPLEGTQLLSSADTLVEFTPPGPSPFTGSQVFFVIFVPILIFTLVRYQRNPGDKIALRVVGFTALLWGACACFFAIAMLLLWAFSEHVHGTHNANLFLMWPTDFVWVYFGYQWLRYAKPLPLKNSSFWKAYFSSHVLVLAAGLLLFIFGYIQQNITRVWSELGAIAALLCLASILMTEKKPQA